MKRIYAGMILLGLFAGSGRVNTDRVEQWLDARAEVEARQQHDSASIACPYYAQPCSGCHK